MNKKLLIQISIVIWTILSGVSCTEKHQAPNILFILVDDLGYADVSYVGTKQGIRTPHIDSLKNQSLNFTNAYSANPVCSPTRASIMTGKYPSTLKLTCHIPAIGMQEYCKKRNTGHSLLEADFIDHLPLEEVTIAEALKSNGYSTAFFGKWHLAGEGSMKHEGGNVNTKWHPENQGFDINIGGNAYGQPASYFSPYKSAAIGDGKKGEYLTNRLTNEAMKYMKTSRKKPFFCFLSYYSIHTPLQVPEKYLSKNKNNRYNAMINMMDDNIGKLTAFLKQEDLEKNTVVIFYSDNGGTGSNPPLRGSKGSLLEGGIRVPLLIKSPKTTTVQRNNNTPVTSPDLFPTILDIAHINSDQYTNLEGISLYPLLTQDKIQLDKRAIYWHYPHHRNTAKSMACAILEDNWKLIYEFESKDISLYNICHDPYEKYNLATTENEKVNYLLKKLQDWQKGTEVVMPRKNSNF